MMKLSERGTVWQHRKARFVRVTSEVAKLESQNAALLDALIVAERFMALAIDASPRDYEKQRIVQEAIHKAKGEQT